MNQGIRAATTARTATSCLGWFDMAASPYKTMRSHQLAVRTAWSTVAVLPLTELLACDGSGATPAA